MMREKEVNTNKDNSNKSFLNEVSDLPLNTGKSQGQDQILLPSTSQVIRSNKKNKASKYRNLSDDDKLRFIEEEILETVETIDESLQALNMYEQQTSKIPHGIYDLKNKFLENRRQALKSLFDIVSHKQKLEKEQAKGDSIVDIIKQ